MSRGIQPVLNHYSERMEGRGVGAPALFEHPLNGFPTSQTPRTYTQTCVQRPTLPLQHILSQSFSLTHAHIQTHFLRTLTHALITRAFPLPTVTDKQCPPLTSPPSPLLHFSSHQLRSSPFLLCCGSSDRGIPSLLMLPTGWCAQMKTMYSNGSAKLPQFPANNRRRSRGGQIAPVPHNDKVLAFASEPLLRLLLRDPHCLPKASSTPLLIHKAPPLGLTVQKLHAALLLEKWHGWVEGGESGGLPKREFSKEPWAALETFTC